jgi:putative lipoprotein
MKSLIPVSILLLLLAACVPASPISMPTTVATTTLPDETDETVTATPPGATDTLTGTQWTLVSLGPVEAETPVVEGSIITLEFAEGGQAGGSGGCNTYGGTYEVQDGTLSFSQITSTLMACVDENAMQQETEYFAALETAGEFTLTDEQLTIWYDNGQGVLNFNQAGSATTTPESDTPATTPMPEAEAATVLSTVAG